MDVTVYSEYGKDRQGFFFGLTGPRLILLVAAGIPVVWALSRQNWPLFAALGVGWVVLVLLVAVPIAGRPAVGWLAASIRFTVGSAAGWTSFRSRAARGMADDLDQVDLPGVLDAVTVHDGPPHGVDMRRVRSSSTTPPAVGRSPPPSPIPVWLWLMRPIGTARVTVSPRCLTRVCGPNWLRRCSL